MRGPHNDDGRLDSRHWPQVEYANPRPTDQLPTTEAGLNTGLGYSRDLEAATRPHSDWEPERNSMARVRLHSHSED